MLLSIIIPCYNSARFLASTLDQLIDQGLDQCEVILINDGSTDETGSIIKQYAGRCPAIRVIDQLNGGVAVARNVGIDAAQGRYIYFLDSDDTLTEGSIDFFKQIIIAHPDCQFFAFGYESRSNGKLVKSYQYPNLARKVLSGEDALLHFFHKELCIHICSSLYESRFLAENKLQFKEGVRIGEDVQFLLQALQKASKIFYSDRLTFIYQLRSDSVTQGQAREKYDRHDLNALLEIQQTLDTMPDKLALSRNFFAAYYYMTHIVRYLRTSQRNPALGEQLLACRHWALRSFPITSGRHALVYLFTHLPLRCFFVFKQL